MERCKFTWNPPSWPHTTRCVLDAVHPPQDHQDRYGRTHPVAVDIRDAFDKFLEDHRNHWPVNSREWITIDDMLRECRGDN